MRRGSTRVEGATSDTSEIDAERRDPELAGGKWSEIEEASPEPLDVVLDEYPALDLARRFEGSRPLRNQSRSQSPEGSDAELGVVVEEVLLLRVDVDDVFALGI